MDSAARSVTVRFVNGRIASISPTPPCNERRRGTYLVPTNIKTERSCNLAFSCSSSHFQAALAPILSAET